MVEHRQQNHEDGEQPKPHRAESQRKHHRSPQADGMHLRAGLHEPLHNLPAIQRENRQQVQQGPPAAHLNQKTEQRYHQRRTSGQLHRWHNPQGRIRRYQGAHGEISHIQAEQPIRQHPHQQGGKRPGGGHHHTLHAGEPRCLIRAIATQPGQIHTGIPTAQPAPHQGMPHLVRQQNHKGRYNEKQR